MDQIVMMTLDEQIAARKERLEEEGTEAPCPFCRRPRVKRSDYIRCNPCGTNWMDGEPMYKDPRRYRMEKWLREQKEAGVRSITNRSGAQSRPVSTGSRTASPAEGREEDVDE